MNRSSRIEMSEFTLILVEDDAELRQRLSCLLSEHGSFELLSAVGTVAEGLDALEKYKPDVLLTDLDLPDGTGVDIIKAIEQLHLDTQAMVI